MPSASFEPAVYHLLNLGLDGLVAIGRRRSLRDATENLARDIFQILSDRHCVAFGGHLFGASLCGEASVP